MNYRSGFNAVEEAIEKASSQGSGGNRASYISWKSGERKFLRFIDDAPITIGMHEFVRCHDGKNRNFVCAQDLANPRSCYICNNVTKTTDKGTFPAKPRDVTIALAAFREEYKDSDGRLAYRDVLEDKEVSDSDLLEQLKDAGVKIEGNKVIGIPKIGFVQQSPKNFWSQMNAYYSRYGTTSDRDYEISRQGERLETKYTMIPCDPVDGLRTQDEVAEHYAVPVAIHPSVVDFIESLGSEDFYNRALLGQKSNNEDSGSRSSEGSSEAFSAAEAPAASAGTSQSLSERLKAYKKS